MTQRDLAAAVDYSGALISSLEKAKGQPNLEAVITRFVPALGLQDDPAIAADLIARQLQPVANAFPRSVWVPLAFSVSSPWNCRGSTRATTTVAVTAD